MNTDEHRLKILVSGAYGFVGSNLSQYLAERGHEVWALDVPEVRRETSFYARDYGWEQLGKIAWDSLDAVVHLAGKAHDTNHTSNEQSYFDINVGLTEKLAAASQLGWHGAEGAHKFILFSSVKACADTLDSVLDETAIPSPQTPYGRSKLAAEGVVEKYFATSGKFYNLRPCMIHGPGNKGNLNLLYRVVKSGMPWPLGAFDNKRSFASIGNVCAVVAELLTAQCESGVYQVADDDTLSTNKLIEMMGAVMGRKAQIWSLPASLVRAVARCGDFLHLPLDSERLKKLTESYIVSNTKILKTLGWKKMPETPEEGFTRSFSAMNR